MGSPPRPPVILVVDDTPADIRLMDAVLAPRGYRVLGASSGSEALEQVAREPPDLILLDVLMPRMDGYETCRRLRQAPKSHFLPVVMLTASTQGDRLKALEAGADDFIAKPFDTAELFARVGSLLRVKQYHDTIEVQRAELAEWNRSLEVRVRDQLQQLDRLERFRRFVSPQLAELLVSSGDDELLESHRREIAVAHCALRGFANLTVSAEPEVVMGVLHAYHAALGHQIFHFGGTVGHIAGETVMVFFNDPVACPEPAERAVLMVLRMRQELQPLLQGWRKLGYDLAFGAGVELGYATLGQIGFEARVDYGAIGPVTYVAAGLCEGALNDQILVSQRVYHAVEHQIEGSSVGGLDLSGSLRSVLAYSVFGLRGGSAVELPPEPTPTPLTRREEEVVVLVARGLSNREVADELVLSERTVEAHLDHVRSKLGLRSRTHIAAWAVEQRLTAAADNRVR